MSSCDFCFYDNRFAPKWFFYQAEIHWIKWYCNSDSTIEALWPFFLIYSPLGRVNVGQVA